MRIVDKVRIGGWYRLGHPRGDLVKVLGIHDADGFDVYKQYFDPMPRAKVPGCKYFCPNGCYEGDGGMCGLGPDRVPFYEVPDEHMAFVYCDHCGEDGVRVVGESDYA